MSFPEIGVADGPRIEISNKFWVCFLKIGPAHDPENDILENILDEFSRICH